MLTVIRHWVALVPSIKYDTRSHHINVRHIREYSDWLVACWSSLWLVKTLILSSSPRGGRSKTNKQETFIASQTSKQLTSNKKWLILKVIRKLFFFLWMKIKKSSLAPTGLSLSNLDISLGICESNAWLVDIKAKLEFIQMNVESSLCNLCK